MRDFVTRHPFRLPAIETLRLISAVGALGDTSTADEVRVALAAAYGARMPDAILRASAETLARRVAAVRRRHIARTNFKDMLYGAQLPTRGRARRRGAQRDAGGDGAGRGRAGRGRQPGGAQAGSGAGRRRAQRSHAVAALELRALAVGVGAAAGLLAILLVVVGGPLGLLSLPLALAPLAAAIAPAALLGEPVGLPTIAFYAGALAAGAILAMAVADRARGRRHAARARPGIRVTREGRRAWCRRGAAVLAVGAACIRRRLRRAAVAHGRAARRPSVDPARLGAARRPSRHARRRRASARRGEPCWS